MKMKMKMSHIHNKKNLDLLGKKVYERVKKGRVFDCCSFLRKPLVSNFEIAIFSCCCCFVSANFISMHIANDMKIFN